MADLVWREDTQDTTSGTVVGYSLWDRDTNKKLGAVVTSPTPDEKGNWVKISLNAPFAVPEDGQSDFADLDQARAAVRSYVE